MGKIELISNEHNPFSPGCLSHLHFENIQQWRPVECAGDYVDWEKLAGYSSGFDAEDDCSHCLQVSVPGELVFATQERGVSS